METKAISIIVPCFNEERTIYNNLKKIHFYISTKVDVFEIITVNDGSKDQTIKELLKAQAEFPLKIIDNKINYGKGRAVRDGVLASKHEIVMFLDADLAIPIEELGKFISALDQYDVAIASRFVPGLKIVKPVLWYRKIMEQVFRILRMLIINNFEIKDTQCGFKVFKKDAAFKIFPQLTVERFAFDSEIIFLAKKFNLKIKELPITLQNPIKSHVRIIRDPFNMTIDLLKIRLNDLLGKYKY